MSQKCHPTNYRSYKVISWFTDPRIKAMPEAEFIHDSFFYYEENQDELANAMLNCAGILDRDDLLLEDLDFATLKNEPQEYDYA